MAKEEQLFQTSGKLQRTHVVPGIRALHNHVIVTDMSFEGRQLSSGIVLLGDDGKTDGIRPRWAKVYKIGPKQKEVNIGQWVLVEHGRWTRTVEVEQDDGSTLEVRMVDGDAILLSADAPPEDHMYRSV